MLRKIRDTLRPNPFDRLVKKAASENQNRFLVVWNRGLGDIPLGLYALVYRIRSFIPNASITFLTRPDLTSAFEMLENVHILSCPQWKRGKPIDVAESLANHQLTPDVFDVILEKPDPTKWFRWQLGTLTPKLQWQDKWDALSEKYDLKNGETYIGVHVDTETGGYYGYEKNWPLSHWQELFKRIHENRQGRVILFGLNKDPAFLMDNIIDLRGDTSVFDMLSVIKNYCQYLVVPDSGVLSIAYYVASDFPVRVVSLWADPRQGVLRQKVASPNKQFQHIPLIGENDCVANISSESAYRALFNSDGKEKTSTISS